MKIPTPNYKKVLINSRISEDVNTIMNNAINYLGFEKRQFLELAILNFVETLDKEKYKINGMDIIGYAKLRKSRMVRQMQGLFRTEIKSRALFLNNVKRDLVQMMISKTPVRDIKKLLLARKLEALHYEEPEEIIEELDKYMSIDETQYKKTISLLTVQENADIETLKHKNRAIGVLKNGMKENE